MNLPDPLNQVRLLQVLPKGMRRAIHLAVQAAQRSNPSLAASAERLRRVLR